MEPTHALNVADSDQPSVQDLPFLVELLREDGSVERLLARAATAVLAQAIMTSAQREYPTRRIAVRDLSKVN